MHNVLVTGFTPFDGRTVNASWIAARALATSRGAHTLEIPVVWGAPQSLLEQALQQTDPTIIISMGEGRPGWFDIETVARNERKERSDNNGALPAGVPVIAGGAATMHATIRAEALHRQLLLSGAPARISRDAGAFLCEETLYTLEHLKASCDTLTTVVFVHLPPYGTPVTFDSTPVLCDEALLVRFGALLYDAVCGLAPTVT